MTPKHYLTTVLIFSAIFLFCFSAKSQNSSDTIRMEKNGLRTVYYHKNKIVNPYELRYIAYTNKTAEKFLQEAQTLHTASMFLGGVGGFAVGFSAGYAIVRAINNAPVNWAVVLPFLGIGSAFVICGISFDVMAKQRIAVGVNIYNNSIKQKNNANLNLGISTNGMALKLNF
jgi:hypothetical protein